MPVVSRFNFTGGIHTAPGAATPEHCISAINVYSNQGRAVCRLGMEPVEAIGGYQDAPYVGWGAGAAEPGSVSNTGTRTAASGTDTLYIGGDAGAWNRCGIYGAAINYNWGTFGIPLFPEFITYQYRGATDWVTFYPGQVWKPKYDTVTDCSTIAPYIMQDSVALGSGSMNDFHINLVFDPDTMPDWDGLWTVAGQRAHWIRVVFTNATTLRATGMLNHTAVLGAVAPNTSFILTTENRILSVLTWTGRAGDVHRFVSYLYRSSDTFAQELRFTLDGVVMTQSDALQPTTSARVFSPDTRVTAFYNSASDRVVGCIAGHTWFYFSSTDPSIFTLDADPVGAETPYSSLVGGLRGAIPVSEKIAFVDGRYFVAVGETLMWSSPGVYVDLWPNQNELLLADEYGPITAMAVVGGSLAVFKRSITYVMQSDGSADGYDAVPITGGAGAVGSVTPCGDFAMILSEDGIYRFDGAMFTKVSSHADGLFINQMLGSNLNEARGVYYSPLSQWRIFYPSSNSRDVFDAALYVDLSGYVQESGDKEQDGMEIWPQGRYAVTDYGFQGTCLWADTTTDTRKILMGDRYGVVWQLDTGYFDPGAPVYAKVVQSPENVGHAQQLIVRFVNVTLQDVGNKAITVQLIPDSRPLNQRTTSSSPHKTSDSSLLLTNTAVSNSAVAISYPSQITRESNFAVRCRNFSIGVVKAYAGEMEIIAIEVEANGAGRRAEP